MFFLCTPQVEYPDGRTTLVLMPAKFNKWLWVRRGGYLIVDESEAAQADGSSRCVITAFFLQRSAFEALLHVVQMQQLAAGGFWRSLGRAASHAANYSSHTCPLQSHWHHCVCALC